MAAPMASTQTTTSTIRWLRVSVIAPPLWGTSRARSPRNGRRSGVDDSLAKARSYRVTGRHDRALGTDPQQNAGQRDSHGQPDAHHQHRGLQAAELPEQSEAE